MGAEKSFCFDRGSLGDRARLWQYLHQGYVKVLRDPFKNCGPTDCCRNNFQAGLGHYAYQRKNSIQLN